MGLFFLKCAHTFLLVPLALIIYFAFLFFKGGSDPR